MAASLGAGRAVYNVILKCGDRQTPAGTSGGWVNFKAVVAGKEEKEPHAATLRALSLLLFGRILSLWREARRRWRLSRGGTKRRTPPAHLWTVCSAQT